MTPFLTGIGFIGMIYALFLPLALVQIFAMIFLPSLLTPGIQPMAVGKAVYAYVMQTVGVVLMTVGALPAVHGVLEQLVMPVERYTTEMYIAFLVLFATGGLTFLWHEQMAQSIDELSRRVTATLFWFFWRSIATITVITAVLSLLLTMLLSPQPLDAGWWIMPLLTLGYGVLLGFATRTPNTAAMRAPSASPRPMPPPPMPAGPSVLIASRPKTASKKKKAAPKMSEKGGDTGITLS